MIPDHPAIKNVQRTGYANGHEPYHPICPVCGENCETVYYDRWHRIAGCENCVTPGDSWEEPECEGLHEAY